mmetsp:Transcript_74953/g.223339  ORF Transcript_74953/g.223339 Transcript_74953/m.223339 type:complete len:220 (-) Transcript_74953:235-894(-)
MRPVFLVRRLNLHPKEGLLHTPERACEALLPGHADLLAVVHDLQDAHGFHGRVGGLAAGALARLLDGQLVQAVVNGDGLDPSLCLQVQLVLLVVSSVRHVQLCLQGDGHAPCLHVLRRGGRPVPDGPHARPGLALQSAAPLLYDHGIGSQVPDLNAHKLPGLRPQVGLWLLQMADYHRAVYVGHGLLVLDQMQLISRDILAVGQPQLDLILQLAPVRVP